jgi:hypothetical protein
MSQQHNVRSTRGLFFKFSPLVISLPMADGKPRRAIVLAMAPMGRNSFYCGLLFEGAAQAVHQRVARDIIDEAGKRGDVTTLVEAPDMQPGVSALFAPDGAVITTVRKD